MTGLELLLEHIRSNRGFDLTGYKRSSLERRIKKRLEAVGVDSAADYIDYLEVHPEEFSLLFDTILINVTAFFRDPPAWRYLREQALPALLTEKEPDAPIRIWSAGASSGEEAYSLAMVLADALGEEAFRERVKIYATDVDQDALSDARHGVYSLKAAEAVPPDLAERYLERTDTRYTFSKDLRRAVIFGRNDLVQDAPISRIDILACRNTLMYFNAETQARILDRLHFAINDAGILFLGKSEMLLTHTALFKPLELKCRIFSKVPKGQGRRLAFPLTDAEGLQSDPPVAGDGLRDAAWHLGPVPQIAVDAEGRLAMANHAARELFSLGPGDVGRPFRDLELSYRPVELRSAVEQARDQQAPVTHFDVAWARREDDQRRLDVRVTPIATSSGAAATAITFHDVSDQRRLNDELERARRDLEVAYEELQSTVEELETTNEELQSTNEELETTNEELQSTNEELETMNEELQSTNEELEATNDELRERTTDLAAVNGFLETILTALGVGVVAVDTEGRVRLWNERSEDLWGLRESEAVTQHLLSLDIGLPVERLKRPLHDVLADGDGSERPEVEVEATNRRGRPIKARVRIRSLRGLENEVTGAILLVEDQALDGAASDGDGGAASDGDG